MMRQQGTERPSGERGAAAVEAALVLPLILLILFGTVQFGLAWFRAQNLEAAAREGARLAAINYTSDDIKDRVAQAQSAFDPSLVRSNTTIDPLTATGTDRPCDLAGIGGTVSVRVHIAAGNGYDIFIPLWGDYPINYTASGTFRCEKTG